MDRVIVAFLDGSPLSEHALPWAAELADRSAAELHMVRAHLPPLPAPDAMGLVFPSEDDEIIRQAEHQCLTRTADRFLAARPHLPTSAHLIDGDGLTDLAGTLAGYAEKVGAEFAVLATHGRGGLSRFALGSVADSFARRTTVPTLLMHPPTNGSPNLATRPEVRHVLVPLDGSRLAEQAVAPACRLAHLFQTDITLLHVIDPATTAAPLPGLETAGLPADWQPPPAAEHARQYLANVARRIREQNICVHPEVVDNRSAAEAVLAHHNTLRGGVVVLATHGRGGLTRMLLGSVADKVIRGATGPVLVVRPG